MSYSGGFGPNRYSVAPMVDVSNSVFRRIMRLFSARAMLYTPMIASQAIARGKLYLLEHDESELPCTLQLGGCDEASLREAAAQAEKAGFTQVNLNAGCPSDRVSCGSFGAVLMKDPQRLAELWAAMQGATALEVSVKTRIGIDDQDSPEYTAGLVGGLHKAGCRHVILHARKAWLQGLSPRQNRSVPPLNYGRVYGIKEMFPDLRVTVNGGIRTIKEILGHLTMVDGVMQGRAVIDDPYVLAFVDREVFGEQGEIPSREEILYRAIDLYESEYKGKLALHHFARHLLGLFSGCANARLYRRHLSENMNSPGADGRVMEDAYRAMGSVIEQTACTS